MGALSTQEELILKEIQGPMRDKSTLTSIDFEIIPLKYARVSIFDRGFLFGDSVYEVVRTYGGRPLALERHYNRLKRSAQALGFDLPFDGATMADHFSELIERLDRDSCYLRVIVTRGNYDIVLCPPDEVTPSTVIIAGELPPWPDDYYEQGITLVTVGIRRNPRGALNPMIKSGNYLNNVLATIEAKEAGATEAVMLNAAGHVTESSTANIFFVKEGMLYTPPLEAGILDGVSRYMVMELALRFGIDCKEKLFESKELHAADEVFLTSTTREVMPVREMDQQPIPAPGPITSKLLAGFREYVRELC
jgi:branched-chain amino acid aminotransferase